jgi:sulfur carrier protein
LRELPKPDAAATIATLMIAVTINGERRQFEEPLRFQQLLERLELAGRRIAVERNGEIVPRSEFTTRSIADGDKLEIVVAVGGG